MKAEPSVVLKVVEMVVMKDVRKVGMWVIV